MDRTIAPSTVQEQVDDAISYGLDGIIVYVDQAGNAPGFYAAGWINRVNQVPADPQALFKIGSISKLYIIQPALHPFIKEIVFIYQRGVTVAWLEKFCII